METKAHIAVIGAGWWSQGWHLPHLSRNATKVELVAIVDTCSKPQSSLNPNGMESLAELSKRYNCPFYSSIQDMLEAAATNKLDGVIVCTNHSSHYDIACELDLWSKERQRQQKNTTTKKPLCLFMEKPMTTCVRQAKALHQLISTSPAGTDTDRTGSIPPPPLDRDNIRFLLNHSANYRTQAKSARDAVQTKIGRIRHVSASMECPLQFLFDNPANTGWVLPDNNNNDKNDKSSEKMLGNGFGWGQSCHLLGWIYHVCNPLKLVPLKVFCCMNHSETTGADVSFSATVHCRDDIVMNLSGTALVPGFEHSDPPVSKMIRIHIYGTNGAILYSGKDREKDSGKLELITTTTSTTMDRDDDSSSKNSVATTTEHTILSPDFEFENTETKGTGPESLQNFIAMCLQKKYYSGADTLVGLRTVQTVEAMYRSNMMGQVVDIMH